MNGSEHSTTATEQGRGAAADSIEAFIARWGTSSGAERANYQIFLAELCDLLGLPRPDPSVADEAANRYVFDKAVTFQNPDGKTSTGYIDLYRRGAFVCETKQSVVRESKDPLSLADPAAPKARRKSGTSVRGTAGWDDSMIAARGRLGVGNDPRYNKTACFDPFPFPAATEAQQRTIRELGEALDAHRKKQQAAHPGLTITGMYNVLEKLRSGEALTDKEKKIHDDGLVSVLKKIHDDLDAAVFDAYGWPATLSDDEILERLVAFNHERAAEEKRGLIRWLRPEFQAKGGSGDVQTEIDVADDDDEAPAEPAEKKPKRSRGAGPKSREPQPEKPRAVAKQPWPKDLAEQTRAVRTSLAACGGIVTAADLARHFKNAKAPRVEEILDTLVALGHARRTDSGYASA